MDAEGVSQPITTQRRPGGELETHGEGALGGLPGALSQNLSTSCHPSSSVKLNSLHNP